MKNATAYQKKLQKFLGDMKKVKAAAPPTGIEAVEVLVRSILEADVTDSAAEAAFQTIRQEYVDINELRVSPIIDITDRLGHDFPQPRLKAEAITGALNKTFDRTYAISIDYMKEMTKRDLRRHLLEIGLSPYAAACVVLKVFGGHAVPVDDTLVEVLKMDGCVHPDSDLQDVQGFLERVIPQKDAFSAHAFLREYVVRSAKALARKRKADAEAAAKAEAEAKAKAEAEAALQAERAKKRAKAARKKRDKQAKKDKKAKKRKAAGKAGKKTPAKAIDKK